MSRAVPRRGSQHSVGILVVLLIGVAVSAGMVALPAEGFNLAETPRSTAINVVSDETGIVGIDPANEVTSGHQSELVSLGNRFGTNGQVTVTLHGLDGTLFVDTDGDGTVEKQAAGGVTFEFVADGTADTVYLKTQVPHSRGFTYEIHADFGETAFTATRQGRVTSPGNGGGPPGNGGGPPGNAGANCSSPPCNST